MPTQRNPRRGQDVHTLLTALLALLMIAGTLFTGEVALALHRRRQR